MKISVLTLFPEYFEPLMTTSILKRAKEKDLFEFDENLLYFWLLFFLYVMISPLQLILISYIIITASISTVKLLK